MKVEISRALAIIFQQNEIIIKPEFNLNVPPYLSWEQGFQQKILEYVLTTFQIELDEETIHSFSRLESEFIPDTFEQLAEMLQFLEVHNTKGIKITSRPYITTEGMADEEKKVVEDIADGWINVTLPFSYSIITPLLFLNSRARAKMKMNECPSDAVYTFNLVETVIALEKFDAKKAIKYKRQYKKWFNFYLPIVFNRDCCVVVNI